MDCCICENLEAGDTLYASSDWDGGLGFDYIRDIQYCPVCGRKLAEPRKCAVCKKIYPECDDCQWNQEERIMMKPITIAIDAESF